MATILIIDDHAGCRRAAARLLGQVGYHAITAENVWQGLRTLETETVDLVLLDLDLPHMNGLDFLREIEADPRRADLPVIIVSGHRPNRTLLLAHRRHVRDWLVKADFSGEELLERVGQHVLRRQAASVG